MYIWTNSRGATCAGWLLDIATYILGMLPAVALNCAPDNLVLTYAMNKLAAGLQVLFPCLSFFHACLSLAANLLSATFVVLSRKVPRMIAFMHCDDGIGMPLIQFVLRAGMHPFKVGSLL